LQKEKLKEMKKLVFLLFEVQGIIGKSESSEYTKKDDIQYLASRNHQLLKKVFSKNER